MQEKRKGNCIVALSLLFILSVFTIAILSFSSKSYVIQYTKDPTNTKQSIRNPPNNIGQIQSHTAAASIANSYAPFTTTSTVSDLIVQKIPASTTTVRVVEEKIPPTRQTPDAAVFPQTQLVNSESDVNSTSETPLTSQTDSNEMIKLPKDTEPLSATENKPPKEQHQKQQHSIAEEQQNEQQEQKQQSVTEKELPKEQPEHHQQQSAVEVKQEKELPEQPKLEQEQQEDKTKVNSASDEAPTTTATITTKKRVKPDDLDSLISNKCFVDPVQTSQQNKYSEMDGITTSNDIIEQCKDITLSTLTDTCSIPNIVHFVWTATSPTERFFGLLHYISLKSVVLRWRSIKIYIHGFNFPVQDEYWKKAVSEMNIQTVESRKATMVWDTSLVGCCTGHHQADVLRLEALIRFGGIYIDWDVFALHDIYEMLQTYDSLLGDQGDGGLTNGMMFAKRCNPFFLEWYKAYRNHDKNLWDESSIRVPYRLYHDPEKQDLAKLVHKDDKMSLPNYTITWFFSQEPPPQHDWSHNILTHHFGQKLLGADVGIAKIMSANSWISGFSRAILEESDQLYLPPK